MSIQLWEILVPAIQVFASGWNKEGFPVIHTEINHPFEWDKYVTELCGGLTIVKKTVGIWESPINNQNIKEEMTLVRIACTREQLDNIIDFTIKYYNQESVFAVKVSDEVIIKYK